MKKTSILFVLLCMVTMMSAEVISIAEAVQIASLLTDGQTTTATYTIEGYVVHAQTFDPTYKNQTFTLADNPNHLGSFRGYRCTAIEDGVISIVLVGDKIQLSGKISRYYDSNQEMSVYEIKNGVATFVEKVDGDHSIPSSNEISVARSIDIGWNFNNTTSSPYYTMIGYVTRIDENSFNTTYNNMCFWIADNPTVNSCTNADEALYVYRGKPNVELHVGDRVKVVAQLQRFGTYDKVVETVSGCCVTCENPIEIDGIYYVFNSEDMTASITYPGTTLNAPAIPSQVLYDGSAYTVISIDDYAFYQNEVLSSITFNDQIIKIGKEAFKGTSIRAIDIPNNVIEVGGNAFSECVIDSVNWNVPSQGDYEILEETDNRIVVSLDPSNINWNVVYLYAWNASNAPMTAAWPGDQLEKDINGRYTCSFPKSASSYINIIWTNGVDQTIDITHVYNSSVYKLRTSSGTYIAYDSRLLEHETSPFMNTLLKSCTFGDDVVRVPGSLCKGQEELAVVDIPQNVVQIGRCAFYGCEQLDSISLKENVTHYGDYAFGGCLQLSAITNFRERPVSLGIGTFDGVDYFNCTLYVPEESVDMYKASGSDWKDFYFIKPLPAEISEQHLDYDVEDADFNATFNSYTLDESTMSDGYSWLIASNETRQAIQMLMIFPRGKTDLEAGIYPIDSTGVFQSVYAGQGVNERGDIIGSFACNFDNEGYIIDPFWYLVSGTVIVDEDGNIDVDALNSYNRTIRCHLKKSSEAIENITIDKANGTTKLLRNGQIYILRGEKTYTTDGRLVR